MTAPHDRGDLFGALCGFLGSILVGLGFSSSGWSHDAAGWAWGPVQALGSLIPAGMGVPLGALGVLLLSVGWTILGGRPSRIGPRRLLVLWSLPLLLVPPVASADAWLYADCGWILAQGASPYEVGLGTLGGPYAALVDPVWLGQGVAYPALALDSARLGVWATGYHPYWGMIAQRALAVAGVAVVAALLPRLAKARGVSPDWAAWLVLLNPVTVVHLIGGAHNDALMLAVVVAALWVATQRLHWVSASLVAAPALIGLAMAFKQLAALALIPVVAMPVVSRLRTAGRARAVLLLFRRLVVGGTVAGVTFAAVTWVSGLGFRWVHWLSGTARVTSAAPSLFLGDLLARTAHWFTPADVSWVVPVTRTVVLVAGGIAAAGLLLWRPTRPLEAVAWASLVLILTAESPHPWYLGVPLVSTELVPQAGSDGVGDGFGVAELRFADNEHAHTAFLSSLGRAFVRLRLACPGMTAPSPGRAAAR